MSKYKICVYAICKNEEQFVDRWMDSVSEADEVIVLDTGSTDNSIKKLEERGAKVTVEIIEPWRFDVARNKSLELVPNDCDICVCTDLDEVITAGWRQKLEEIWDKDTTRLSYNYNWSFDNYGNPAVNFYIDKIHDRKNYIWHHPVHEILKYIGEGFEDKKVTDEIVVNHYPDNSKPRSQYLSLLELAVKENPDDDRNMHYLGREYMYKELYEDAITTFHKHLKIPKATWFPEELSASMRFMARCYRALGRMEEAQMWFEKAVIECSNVREAFAELGMFEYDCDHFQKAAQLLKSALGIKERSKNYINENFCWDSTIYDILSLCCYNLELYEEAYDYVCEALKIDPKNKRIKQNKKIISSMLT